MFIFSDIPALTVPLLDSVPSSMMPAFWCAAALLASTLSVVVGMTFASGHGGGDEDGQSPQIDTEALKKSIEALEALSERSAVQTEQLAELYVVQATLDSDNADMDVVLAPLTKAAALLRQALAGMEDGELRRSLGNVFMHQAEVYNEFDEVHKALEFYDQAIATFKPLDEQGDGEAKYDIAGIRLNRGTIYHEIGEFDKAKADLNESFTAYRAVEKISDLDTRYYMAKVSVVQGDLFRDMDEPLEVVVDAYNRAMRLFVELIDIGQTEHERDLANALLRRCMAIYEDAAGKDGQSDAERQSCCDNVLIDVGRAVDILNKLDGEDNMDAHYDLFDALVAQGALLLDIGRYDETVQVFDRAIEKFADLADAADPVTLNHYASAFENRGLSLLNLEKQAQAIADFDQAAQLRQKIVSDEFGLDDSSKAVFISALATTFANRANAHADNGDMDKALADGRQGLELMRSIANAGDDGAEFREIEKLFEEMIELWK